MSLRMALEKEAARKQGQFLQNSIRLGLVASEKAKHQERTAEAEALLTQFSDQAAEDVMVVKNTHIRARNWGISAGALVTLASLSVITYLGTLIRQSSEAK